MGNRSMPKFALRKWYLDAASDLGNVYIGYCVSLKWGKFEINGLQHLWHSVEKGVETQTEITQPSAPYHEGKDHRVWKPGGLEGIWESVEEPIEATLLDTEDGK